MPEPARQAHLERALRVLRGSWHDGYVKARCFQADALLARGDVEGAASMLLDVPDPSTILTLEARCAVACTLAELALRQGDPERGISLMRECLGEQLPAFDEQLLRAHLPAGDLVARYGGEEFVVVRPPITTIAPARDRQDALGLARDLDGFRQVAAITQWRDHVGHPLPTVTASIGVAPVTCGSLEAALTLADQTMYAAKRAGGDRVWTADPHTGAAEQGPRRGPASAADLQP